MFFHLLVWGQSSLIIRTRGWYRPAPFRLGWNSSFWRSEALSTVLSARQAGFGRLDTGSAYRLTAPGMHHCAESEVIASLLFVLKKPSWLIWEWGIQFFFCIAILFSLMDLDHTIVNGLLFYPARSLAQGLQHGFLHRSRIYLGGCVCVFDMEYLYMVESHKWKKCGQWCDSSCLVKFENW